MYKPQLLEEHHKVPKMQKRQSELRKSTWVKELDSDQFVHQRWTTGLLVLVF